MNHLVSRWDSHRGRGRHAHILSCLAAGEEVSDKWAFPQADEVSPINDLRGIDLRGVTLERPDFAHRRLDFARLDGGTIFLGAMNGCVLDFASCRRVRWVQCDAIMASARATRLDGAHLSRVRFTNAHLIGTSFFGATLIDVDFSSSEIVDCCLEESVIVRARFGTSSLELRNEPDPGPNYFDSNR